MPSESGLRHRLRIRSHSVRFRTTLAAVLVVGAATTAGALVLVVVLRGLLTDEVAATADRRASEVAALLRAGSTPPEFAVADAEEELVQVVRPDGVVLSSSRNVRGLPPVVWPPPTDPVNIAGPSGQEGQMVVAQQVPSEAGPAVILVGRTVEPANDAVGFVGQLLAIGLPVLVVVVAVTTWSLVGRTLAPVEAIRREVDEISATALHRRAPEPPGDDEVSRLAQTMNRMLDRLERAHLKQRRFTADASHELRSPVAAIRQYAEVALAHPDRTTVEGLATTVLVQDVRVQRLIEDMLLLARADERGLRPRTVAVDLDDLVFEEARRLRDTTTLRVDTTAVSAGRISGDPGELRRTLHNLGENAARHARTRIAFSLAEADTSVVLTVDDDGPGVPPAERERVLERFVRLDDARTRDAGGSGLGLAIVAELVDAHDGTIRIGDSPDGGARMQLSFPPVPAEAPAVAAGG